MNAVQIVFGWPAVVASILVTAAGIALRNPRAVFVGALFATPFMLYLFASPGFKAAALPVLGAHFAASYVLRRCGRILAAAMFAPFVFVAGYVALVVVAQYAG